MDWYFALIPVAVVLVPLVWADIVTPGIRRLRGVPSKEDRATKKGDVMVGETIKMSNVAVQSITYSRDRAVEDLRAEREGHRQCHLTLREHGLAIPHD